MQMRCLLAVLLFSTSLVLAQTMTQTSWITGPGITGPVTQWSDAFSSSLGMDWQNLPGTVYLGSIPVAPVEFPISDECNGAFCIIASDLDGDGDPDAVASAYTAGTVSWWENSDTSPGLFTACRTIEPSMPCAAGLFPGDVDGDGFTDIAGAGALSGEIVWWRNTDGSGTSWVRNTVDTGIASAWSVCLLDMNQDGWMDLVCAAHQEDLTAWWENMDGSGTSWTRHDVDTDFDGSCSVRTGDMDGDGDPDIVGAGRMADEIVWWENPGSSGDPWMKHVVTMTFDGACSAIPVDIDRDDDTDIAAAAYNDDALLWWENIDGSGTGWTMHVVDNSMDGAFFVAHGDPDMDGCMDLMCSSEDGSTVAWYRNGDGRGESWQKHILTSDFTFAACVTSADLDLDGLPDVAAASFQDSELRWWRVTAPSDVGWLESSILDSGTEADWQYIDWEGDTPASTSISFQVRSSTDPGNMGIWSDTIFTSGSLQPHTDPGDRYIQYRALLQSGIPDITPLLQEVTVTWDPLGLQPGSPLEGFLVVGPFPNPASGSVEIEVHVPETSLLEVMIFELSGRLVWKAAGQVDRGVRGMEITDLHPGVYHAVVHCGGHAWASRLVLLH